MPTSRRTLLAALSVVLLVACSAGLLAYRYGDEASSLPVAPTQQLQTPQPDMAPDRPTENKAPPLEDDQPSQAVTAAVPESTLLQRVFHVLSWSLLAVLAVGALSLMVLVVFNHLLFPDGVHTGWSYLDGSLNMLFSFLAAEGHADLPEDPMAKFMAIAGRGQLLSPSHA